tara:strand:- start:1380 stop:2102 length:723 start_codon:yes stop_codon:yes gene_type:complete
MLEYNTIIDAIEVNDDIACNEFINQLNLDYMEEEEINKLLEETFLYNKKKTYFYKNIWKEIYSYIYEDIDIDCRDSNNDSALMKACEYNNNIELAKTLINVGCNINCRCDNMWSALILASIGYNKSLVNMLIKKGAEINVQNVEGWSALMQASDVGDIEVVKMLIEADAEVNIQEENFGCSPLMWAISGEHTEIVKILIEVDANVNHQDNNGLTPLMYADGNNEIVEMLINAGAKYLTDL